VFLFRRNDLTRCFCPPFSIGNVSFGGLICIYRGLLCCSGLPEIAAPRFSCVGNIVDIIGRGRWARFERVFGSFISRQINARGARLRAFVRDEGDRGRRFRGFAHEDESLVLVGSRIVMNGQVEGSRRGALCVFTVR
jgi:hypothetical protein